MNESYPGPTIIPRYNPALISNFSSRPLSYFHHLTQQRDRTSRLCRELIPRTRKKLVYTWKLRLLMRLLMHRIALAQRASQFSFSFSFHFLARSGFACGRDSALFSILCKIPTDLRGNFSASTSRL